MRTIQLSLRYIQGIYKRLSWFVITQTFVNDLVHLPVYWELDVYPEPKQMQFQLLGNEL